MAEDWHSDKMPNVVGKELLSDSITKPGTEAVQPLPRQPDEDIDLHIPDEQLSIKSDAAAENRQTVGISPGDFDTYAIAYICKDHITYMKTSLEETKTVATEVASNSSHDDDMSTKSADESASCDVTQPYVVKYQKEIVESANNDSEPYIQPYAVGYQEDDEPPSGAPDSGPAASSSINNDVTTNLSSNDGNPTDLVSEERQHVPNALNPNPMYVPNVQRPAACGKMRLSFSEFGYFSCHLIFKK
uniref:Uncharacterized protein n=1 Tax=Branchiostoma floridae TaxID=7739 RepID=C3Z076_BRAFL|eukprot:XP_002598123.1 hypothetical protein BRAFLDRAFT_85659 [Branchiostoma floridae]